MSAGIIPLTDALPLVAPPVLPSVLEPAPPETVVVPVNLRLGDAFACINSRPIVNYQGYREQNAASAAAALETVAPDSASRVRPISQLWIAANDLFHYLRSNITPALCEQVITLVIPGLRGRYSTQKEKFDIDDWHLLQLCLAQDPARFLDLNQYSSLADWTPPYPHYQLLGTITPYDIIHLTVRQFVELINARQNLTTILEPTNIQISLTYQEYDFYDFTTGSLETQLQLPSC